MAAMLISLLPNFAPVDHPLVLRGSRPSFSITPKHLPTAVSAAKNSAKNFAEKIFFRAGSKPPLTLEEIAHVQRTMRKKYGRRDKMAD
jgi:hypothetical protein